MEKFYFLSSGNTIEVTAESLKIAKDLMSIVYRNGFYQVKESNIKKKPSEIYIQRIN